MCTLFANPDPTEVSNIIFSRYPKMYLQGHECFLSQASTLFRRAKIAQLRQDAVRYSELRRVYKFKMRKEQCIRNFHFSGLRLSTRAAQRKTPRHTMLTSGSYEDDARSRNWRVAMMHWNKAERISKTIYTFAHFGYWQMSCILLCCQRWIGSLPWVGVVLPEI